MEAPSLTVQHDPTLIDVLLSQGLDPRARRVYLHHDLDGSGPDADENGKRACQHVVRSLQYLDKTEGPIEFWVSTPGGEISNMFGIYDVVRGCRNEVVTIGFGEICSAGVLILAAGDLRYATENAWLMSHPETGELAGSNDVFTSELRLKALMRQERRFADIMGRRTRRTARWWMDVHKGRTKELWLSARQMVQYGVVDDIWPGSLPPNRKRRR